MSNSYMGLGVMLSYLAGDKRSVKAFKQCQDKIITDLMIKGEKSLVFTFADGTRMMLYDDGQSCCEVRYMTTDDDLSEFIGSSLWDAEVADGPSKEDDEYDDYHDIQFLHVKTNRGVFTIESHNKHNGHYGGFAIKAQII